MPLPSRTAALLIFFPAFCGAAAAAGDDMPPVVYPVIAKAVADRAELVPAGWHVEAEASGDLNGDRRPDLALVLQSDISDVSFNGEPTVGPRMLVVGFASRKGLTPVVSHHRLIPRRDNAYVQDVFDAENGALSVDRGQLSVTLQFFATAGGWDIFTKIYRFAWNGSAFQLAGFDYDYGHRATGITRHWIADYKAGTLIFTTGRFSKDAPESTKKSKLPGRRRITLEQVGDGMAFDPFDK